MHTLWWPLAQVYTIGITDFTIKTTWGSNTNVKSTAVTTIRNEDRTDSLQLWVFKIYNVQIRYRCPWAQQLHCIESLHLPGHPLDSYIVDSTLSAQLYSKHSITGEHWGVGLVFLVHHLTQNYSTIWLRSYQSCELLDNAYCYPSLQ